jgi:ligand-binding SRPBCC domain-containing protein
MTGELVTPTGDIMSKSALGEMATNELVRKRLAKLMALECFRNTKLEDLHAGIYPSSQSGDYSDVKVVTPYGEISWERLGRFSDDEMKVLMIDVVDRCYEFLSELLDQRSAAALVDRLKLRDPLPRWNDPQTRS